MGERVEIFEVGPRDGLQNEAQTVDVAHKIELVNLLSDAGFARIEVGSFVSPKWVPQMADTEKLLAGITRTPGVRYAALVPNMQGYAAAVVTRADEIAVFASASEAFSKANTNASIDEVLARFEPILDEARHVDLPVRGYVSCVTGCPFEGEVDPAAVAQVADRLFAMGCYEISLGDTIGKGRPDSVSRMLLAVRDHVPVGRLAGHFHDTGGHAVENVDCALALGVRVFDAAIGGLGGCPYAPGAPGNIATETLNAHLSRLGFETGLNPEALDQAAACARAMIGQSVGHADV